MLEKKGGQMPPVHPPGYAPVHLPSNLKILLTYIHIHIHLNRVLRAKLRTYHVAIMCSSCDNFVLAMEQGASV